MVRVTDRRLPDPVLDFSFRKLTAISFYYSCVKGGELPKGMKSRVTGSGLAERGQGRRSRTQEIDRWERRPSPLVTSRPWPQGLKVTRQVADIMFTHDITARQ